MSFKQYIVLFLMFMGYLTLGAYLFYSVERPLEEERRQLARAEAMEIRDLLRRHYAKGLPQAHMDLLTRLSDYCGKPFYISSIPSVDRDNETEVTPDHDPEQEPFEEKPFLWTFYNSLLFVMCTISTIGYGNLAPTSRHGRILDVIYGLLGIPFTGIVLAQMSEYFGALFMRAHHRYKTHEYQTRLSLIADILTYSGLGVIIFIFFPAAIFVYFEDWTLDTGVYYAFVTLATIGYGDLVAGQNRSDSWVYNVYKVMVLVWIMFGLGYMLMIVGFLTRVMRSKKVRKIEHKLANTIKITQSKIWNEFSQDVTYLRRMLNEIYLMKIQPVYVEKENEEDKEIRRTKSCPNLTEWPVLRKNQEKEESSEEDEEEMAANFRKIAMRRRKGNAENVMAPRIKKTVSEGDLARIDRKATFGEDSGIVDPKLLLAKVVDALGTSVGSKFSLNSDTLSRKLSTAPYGIHGFSDKEILASEGLPSRWSLRASKRAFSEQPTPLKGSSLKCNEESQESRTWGGVNPVDIQKFIKMRANGELRRSSQGFLDTQSLASSKSSVTETSLKAPPGRMRRMSMAVTSLFTPGHKNKPPDMKDSKEVRESKRKRRTGNTPGVLPAFNIQKRMSLPDEDQAKSMLEQANYLSVTTGRRGSVFAALATELGARTCPSSNIPVSPVLEQTSVADFLRLLSSLQAKLDPSLSIPSEAIGDHLNRRKSSTNISRDSAMSPLATLFCNPNITASSQPSAVSSGPENLPHKGKRRVSIFNKTPNLLEAKTTQGRRFSLIPPMDVDHPSDQSHRRDVLQLKRRSTSSQNMLQNSDGSAVNIPSNVVRQRPQRASLSGTARYINSKHQSSDTVKINNSGSTEGYKKFSVRPVSVLDNPPSNVNVNIPMQRTVPTITIDPCDTDPSNEDVDNAEDEGLQDVVVVKL